MEKKGASVVITHHIKDGKQKEYENWLNKIGSVSKSFDGNIDWQIIRPIPDLTFNYTVIIRFDTIENLKIWMESKERKQLIEEITPIFTKDDNYRIKTGLDFLFESEDEKPKPPVRWKQYLVTWSAIFPLSVFVPLIVLPIFKSINLSDNHYLNSFLISGTIVFLMIFVIMPNYTKLIRKWLFK
ncbi:MAG: hypothetical protein PHP53_11670 [Prolixibacteraceae bacterium]|nr:hypothetical protein [Prolixibacteraceae bacterium]